MDFEPTMIPGPLLSWESQAVQYPVEGPPGINYFAGEVDGFDKPVDCLLWRDASGLVCGILNHYSIDYPPWEKAGNVNVWVHPRYQRRGIGRDLLIEAEHRWGKINWQQQRYSPAGVKFARRMMQEGK